MYQNQSLYQNPSISNQIHQCEQLIGQLINQTQQASQMYQQLLQQEQQNARTLEEIAQKEQRAAQMIQSALQGHQTAIQQMQQVSQICRQIEQSSHTHVTPAFASQQTNHAFGLNNQSHMNQNQNGFQ